MDKVKRERSANFTLYERDILVSLIQKYQTVLENKQSDGCTWKKKEAVWESIKNEFNARSGAIFRSTKTLKVKYEGLKRTVRKKSAAIRSELYQTGGGRNTAPPLDNVEEQVKAMITLSADGLESLYDSDVLPQTQESQGSINVPFMEEFMKIPPLDVNMDTEVVESEDTQNQVLLLVPNTSELLPCSSRETVPELLPCSSRETDPEERKQLDNLIDKALHDPPTGKCDITPTSGSKKWDVTSRRYLKSRKHPSLIAPYTEKKYFQRVDSS